MRKESQEIRIKTEQKKFIIQRLLDCAVAFGKHGAPGYPHFSGRGDSILSISENCRRSCVLISRVIISNNAIPLSTILDFENSCTLWLACLLEVRNESVARHSLTRALAICRYLRKHSGSKVAGNGVTL